MMTGAAIRVRAPAKINLGLELLGKRPDGYHEIRTIMAMVDLADEVRVSPSHDDAIVMGDLPGNERNLVEVARDRFSAAVPERCPARIEITKHIPIAGGLGGASADAAATLVALNARLPHEARLCKWALHEIAASIGSDVPFFLDGPIALASGTGTTITALPALANPWHVVLVSPSIFLPRKTATLYGSIRPPEFTDGSRIEAVAAVIRDESLHDWDDGMLANPFRVAWHRLGDPLAPYELIMRTAGAPMVALSGAGPTLYAIFPDAEVASSFADCVRQKIGDTGVVHVAAFSATGMVVESDGAA